MRLASPSIPDNVVANDGGLRTATPGPVVMGIDPSLTGFAVVVLDVSTGRYAGWRLKPQYKGTRRLQEIKEFLKAVLFAMSAEDRAVTHTVIEGYAMGTKSHAHAMGEAGGVARLTLLEWFEGERPGFPHVVAPSTLKKYATGKGNSDKALILIHLFKRWGVEFADNNIGDAYALARMGMDLYMGDADTVPMKQALAKVALNDGY